MFAQLCVKFIWVKLASIGILKAAKTITKEISQNEQFDGDAEGRREEGCLANLYTSDSRWLSIIKVQEGVLAA